MRPILFHIGDTAVPAFWTMAFLGFFVSFLVLRRQLVLRGYDAAVAYDVTLWAYVGGWVGARLFVIPSAWDYFVEDPIGILLSGSGWVWYGGLIGGGVAVFAWTYRSGFPIGRLADMASPALAIGLGIGRIGCQLAGDGDWGRPTDLAWGMQYRSNLWYEWLAENGYPPDTHVHPAPLYELAGCLLIFAYTWHLLRRDPPPWHVFGVYLILSGVVRFGIEFVRINPRWLLGFTTAQAMSVAAVAVGLWLIRREARPSKSST